MSGIDLATANEKLTAWLAAETEVMDGKSYTIAGRAYTNHDLSAIREQIDYWDRKVIRLSRGSSIGAHRLIVNG